MAGKSFYDLDYVIELNEQRLLQYTTAYQEVMGRLTTLIIIYSAMAIFLVPMIQAVLRGGITNWILTVSFLLFMSLFMVSVFYTVRFIIPVDFFFLGPPRLYYNEYRLEYEKQIDNRLSVEELLKSSYIDELERTLAYNTAILKRKQIFYRCFSICTFISVTLPFLFLVLYFRSKR